MKINSFNPRSESMSADEKYSASKSSSSSYSPQSKRNLSKSIIKYQYSRDNSDVSIDGSALKEIKTDRWECLPSATSRNSLLQQSPKRSLSKKPGWRCIHIQPKSCHSSCGELSMRSKDSSTVFESDSNSSSYTRSVKPYIRSHPPSQIQHKPVGTVALIKIDPQVFVEGEQKSKVFNELSFLEPLFSISSDEQMISPKKYHRKIHNKSIDLIKSSNCPFDPITGAMKSSIKNLALLLRTDLESDDKNSTEIYHNRNSSETRNKKN